MSTIINLMIIVGSFMKAVGKTQSSLIQEGWSKLTVEDYDGWKEFQKRNPLAHIVAVNQDYDPYANEIEYPNSEVYFGAAQSWSGAYFDKITVMVPPGMLLDMGSHEQETDGEWTSDGYEIHVCHRNGGTCLEYRESGYAAGYYCRGCSNFSSRLEEE